MINKNCKKIISDEILFQSDSINLKIEDNLINKEISDGCGSILTNKYAEGYPGKRYYGGCKYIDKIENEVINCAKILFNVEYSNVQSHSLTQANSAILLALLKPGDKIFSIGLMFKNTNKKGYYNDLYFSRFYKLMNYDFAYNNLIINYCEIEKLIIKFQPKLIFIDPKFYSRTINWNKISEICEKINAYLIVDISSISGLIISKLYPSPMQYADVVVTKTNGSLCGPQGAIILAKKRYKNKIDKAIFPGIQGGPLIHNIYGKGLCLINANKKDFIYYQQQSLKNAHVISNFFRSKNIKIIYDFTTTNKIGINIKTNFNLSIKDVEKKLFKFNILITKKINYKNEFVDEIWIGTYLITTLGYRKKECKILAEFIYEILINNQDSDKFIVLRKKIKNIQNKLWGAWYKNDN